jgi:O-antigen/teichoic acid export membrane protein
MLSMALSNLLRPRLSLAKGSNDSAAFQRMYKRALSIVLLCGLLATGAVTLIGSLVVELLFGTELAGAGSLLPFAMIYATIDALTTCQMVARQIDDTNGAAHTARFRIYAAILSLTLLVPMTHYLGLQGSIGALIIAEIFYGVFVNAKRNEIR